MRGTIAAVVFAIVASSGCYGEESASQGNETRIRFTFADNEIIVSMVDNSAARSLVAMLPLTLEFEDYAGSEKISYLPEELDSSDVPDGYDPSIGDLALYAPWGNLAFFYEDQDYADGLVPLGTIVSGSEFLEEMDSVSEVTIESVE